MRSFIATSAKFMAAAAVVSQGSFIGGHSISLKGNERSGRTLQQLSSDFDWTILDGVCNLIDRYEIYACLLKPGYDMGENYCEIGRLGYGRFIYCIETYCDVKCEETPQIGEFLIGALQDNGEYEYAVENCDLPHDVCELQFPTSAVPTPATTQMPTPGPTPLLDD